MKLFIEKKLCIIFLVAVLFGCTSSEFQTTGKGIFSNDKSSVALIGDRGYNIWIIIKQNDEIVFDEEVHPDGINMMVCNFDWNEKATAFAIKTRFYDGGSVQIKIYDLKSHSVMKITKIEELAKYPWISFDFDGFSMKKDMAKYFR